MKAADIMTEPVITVAPDAAVLDAAKLMLEKQIGGLPVIDRPGHVVGMLTEGDLLRRVEIGTIRHRPRWLEFFVGSGRLANEYVHSHGRKVAELMSRDPYVVEADASLESVVHLMEDADIKRVPVLRQGELVGIITRRNLVRALAHLMRKAPRGTHDDDEIRERILAELAKQRWAPVNLSVAVSGGVADLHGIVTDERQRQAVKVAVENIAGVKAVHDHLVRVEPLSATAIEPPADVAGRGSS